MKAVAELKRVFQTENLAPIALRWILMHEAISTVIPGASRKEQVINNIEASKILALSSEQMREVEKIYDKYIRENVHKLW